MFLAKDLVPRLLLCPTECNVPSKTLAFDESVIVGDLGRSLDRSSAVAAEPVYVVFRPACLHKNTHTIAARANVAIL